MQEDESEEEWRFSVDEFEDSSHAADSSANGDPTAERASADATPVRDGDEHRGDDHEGEEYDGEGNVAGEFSPNVPVVPEMPRLENAVFVTLGATLTVVALASVVGGATFGLTEVLFVAVIVGGIGALAYGAFVRLTPDT